MLLFQVTIALFVLFCLAIIGYAAYVRIRSHLYTRERYAFAALSATVVLVGIGVSAVLPSGPWGTVVYLWALTVGTAADPPPPHWAERALVLIFVAYAISRIHRSVADWNGQISLAQYQRDRLHEQRAWVLDALEELGRIARREGSPEVYQRADHSGLLKAPEPPRDTLTWRDEARDLLTLHRPSYTFDPHGGWHEARSCWVGQNNKTGAVVGLFCAQNEVGNDVLISYAQYIRQLYSQTSENNFEFFAAIASNGMPDTINLDDVAISQLTRASLLNDLVDFSDYFREIRRRVENDQLPDSDLTLLDVYVPSHVAGNETSETSLDLEEYLSTWIAEPGQRQLALLGEYGQGKSTGTLTFAYKLVTRGSPSARAPILIELRGKSPSTLQPLELLGAWCSSYRIDPQALFKLLVAGRLLIIFEGFDEMAGVADAEARLNHFRSLWRFCYPKAKILFTGRPNLFLDNRELKRALGIERSVATGPYCENIQLQPFTLDQIAQSLRSNHPTTRQQIVDLARQDAKFFDIVSRPSLLHMVSSLWDAPEIVANKHNMSSATIIGVYIMHLHRRQTEKKRILLSSQYARSSNAQADAEFMNLTESERIYFTNGIAAYMAANDLQNQITRDLFDDAIKKLYKEIPDEVSTNPNAMSGEPALPLKDRLADRDDALEVVQTDVRTYGLLVHDFSRQGALKFPHKSFAEYLYSAHIAQRISGPPDAATSAVGVATGPTLEKILKMPDALAFLGEILAKSNIEDGRAEDLLADVKRLYRLLVIDEITFPLR